MSRPPVQFALIVERGPLEAQAVLLVESLRRWSGRYADCPIEAISPRPDFRPAAATIARLEALGAVYHPIGLDSPVPAYGPSFRVLGLGWLARQSGPEVLVQLDSDTLFTGEPDFDLGDAVMLARPPDEQGMASAGHDSREAHWAAMCRACGVAPDALGWVQPACGGPQVRGTYNAGLIAGPRELFSEAEACFQKIVAAGLRSWPGRSTGESIGAGEASAAGYGWWGTSQAAVTIAAARLGGEVRLLDARHNVPLHRLDRLDALPARPVHLHYHWLFTGADAALSAELDVDPAVRDWIDERLPLPLRVTEGTAVFSPAPTAFDAPEARSPACSVVMTSFCDTRYLREAVASVLAQDHADFELIVVDDGSPDPAPVAALPALDPRVQVLRLDANRGTAEAANRGIALARAPLIARLDSDDIAERGWLSAALRALRDDPGLGLVGAAVTLIDASGAVLGTQPTPESDFAIRFTLLFHSPFYHSGTVYRRALFDAAGGYRADQPVSQDHYLWAAMLPRARARNLPAPLVRYRINPDGLTASNGTGDPTARTRPIRESAWREIGLPFPLADRRLAGDASAILRGLEVADRGRRQAAAELIGLALRRVVALAPEFQRADEAIETNRFVADLSGRLAAAAPPPASLPKRVLNTLRRRGLPGLIDAVQRRIAARRPGARQPGGLDPVTAALHTISPYAGFVAANHPADLQGWGSDDPVFRALIAELRPALIVEVGSWKGASAVHMAGLAREFGLSTRIVCVDTWLGSSEHLLGRKPGWREALRPRHGYPQLYHTFLGNVVRAGHAERIVPFPATSDTAAIVLAEKGLRPELIYLDAAHEEEAVARDLAAYWPLLRPGGVLIGDDFAKFPAVRRAAQRFAREHDRSLEDWGDKFVLRKPA